MLLALLLQATVSLATATPPADCTQAVAEVRESRRLLRNTGFALSTFVITDAFDVATTAKFKHDFACRDTRPGQICLVEDNAAFPITAGLVAGKVGLIAAKTVVYYLLDRAYGRTKARWIRWARDLFLVGANVPPVYAGIHNLVEMQRIGRGTTGAQ